ncbi:hypothetical protein [Streptomyces sp. NPDC005890]|uniref:hypothetical protein n=1 Tax=Streptomyces sp. NPDC005890 TaxID=3154568 RepID=UPI0033C36E62
MACPGSEGTLMNGGRMVLARTPHPVEVLPLMAAEKVTTTTAAVPTRWTDAVSSGRQLGPVRRDGHPADPRAPAHRAATAHDRW